MDKFLFGDTKKLTWISSGTTPTLIYSTIFDGNESSVNSSTMTSSGNGHYYANMTLPNTPGFYVRETYAWVNSFPYRNRERFKVIKSEVD